VYITGLPLMPEIVENHAPDHEREKTLDKTGDLF
jgi:hypothetical protein